MATETLRALMDRVSHDRPFRKRLGREPELFTASAGLTPGEVGVMLVTSGRLLCDPALIGWRDDRPCPCCVD
jgi:hypothetical protein